MEPTSGNNHSPGHHFHAASALLSIGATSFEQFQADHCAAHLYNRNWDGYRLADMTQSRLLQHSAGGMAYHLRHFPHSLVARFDHDYMQHLAPGGRLIGERFRALWDMNCTNSLPLPTFAHSLQWKTGERLSCQCPYPQEHFLRALPREDRHNLFIPAASALLDILCRERQLATPTAATDQLGASVSLWKRTAAVHIRAGEVIDMSPHSVDAMLEKQTRFGSKCHSASNSEAGRPWTGTPCMEVHAFDYVMPLAYFELVRRSLCERRISLVVLVAGSALNLTRGFSKSCDYLGRVAAFFARSGFRVALRLGQPPDDDFRFFSRVSAYVPSGGAYSQYAAAVAEALGVHVIRPNRSLYAYAQPSAGARCCDNVDRSECSASSVAEGAAR